jgi:hypothetical protein
MKIISLVVSAFLGSAAVTVLHAVDPLQAKAPLKSPGKNKEWQKRKLELAALLDKGAKKFCAAAHERPTGGDRGLSYLLKVAMEPDLNVVRAALTLSSKGREPMLNWAYFMLLSDILFEYPKEDLRRWGPGRGDFLYLDSSKGRLSIAEGWGLGGLFVDPVGFFDEARKTRKRRNLDRFKGQISKR